MKIQPLRSFAHVRAFQVRSVLILFRQETEAFSYQSEGRQDTSPLRTGLAVDVERHLGVPATSRSSVSLLAIHSAS